MVCSTPLSSNYTIPSLWRQKNCPSTAVRKIVFNFLNIILRLKLARFSFLPLHLNICEWCFSWFSWWPVNSVTESLEKRLVKSFHDTTFLKNLSETFIHWSQCLPITGFTDLHYQYCTQVKCQACRLLLESVSATCKGKHLTDVQTMFIYFI